MIRFTEGLNNPEKEDVHDGINGDIKSDGMTIEEAKSFWRNIFVSLRDNPLNELTEEELYEKVFRRTEEEFSFEEYNIDENEQLKAILSQFNYEHWNELSEEDKYNLIADLKEELASVLGIKIIPKIDYYESDAWDCGAYNTDDNTISINRNNLDDPTEILDTVAHELRHAYQYQKAKDPKTEMDYLYAYNFENYISPYFDILDYQDQLIEAEARAFAGLFNLEVVAGE